MNTMSKNKTKVITMRVTDSLDKNLEKLSLQTDRSKSYLAEKAVSEYVNEMSWLLAEAEKGQADIEQGNIVSHDEMKKLFTKMKAEVKKHNKK